MSLGTFRFLKLWLNDTKHFGVEPKEPEFLLQTVS